MEEIKVRYEHYLKVIDDIDVLEKTLERIRECIEAYTDKQIESDDALERIREEMVQCEDERPNTRDYI